MGIAAVLCACVAVSPGSAAATTASDTIGPSESWLTSLPTDLDGAFKAVSQRIRFEPYPGVLRGARGTALSGSGNSWDKAVLLAELLRRGGYQVRFAEGRLDDGNLAVLLRGAYPPKVPNPQLGPDFAPYEPTLDAQLREATSRHVWLEVSQGETWLPLDPSFPRGKIGEAYAVAVQHFTRPPDDAHQRVRISWMEYGGEGKREVARFEARTSEVGFAPVSLVAVGVPLHKAPPGKKGKSGGAAGLFGAAFSGGQEEPEEEPAAPSGPPVVEGVLIERSIRVGDRTEEAAQTLVRDSDWKMRIDREWLEVTLLVPGRPDRTVKRELLGLDGKLSRAELLRHRRYAIGVFPGPVSLAVLDEQVRQARALGLDDLRSQAEKLSKDASGAASRQVARLESTVGTVAGHLLTLSHAQASDAASDQLARSMGVLVVRDQPRVLIASVETGVSEKDEVDATISLDLRLDEVRAVPWPGQAARAAQVFQQARGMQSSSIEGQVVAQATGRDVVTTAALMAQASRESVPMVALSLPTGRGDVYRMEGLESHTRTLLAEAIDKGRHAIVPQRPVTMGGRPRFGWWEIDPASGAAIGVMDDGLHQAMVQYSFSVDKIGMNKDTGKVVGMIVGALTTEFLLATKVLEHGGITAKALKEIKDRLEAILCSSCPGAEAKAEVSASVGNDCLSIGKSKGVEASAKIDFCESYSDGFKCSVGVILAAYEGKSPYEVSGSVGFNAETELCVGGAK